MTDRDIKLHLSFVFVMATVNFNVGGKEFTISKNLIYKSHKLDYLDGLRISDEPIFLDYNYDAFSVVLDFLRHDQILVPPSVNAKLVELIIDELGIQLPHSQRQILVKAAVALPKPVPSQNAPPTVETTSELPPQYTPSSTMAADLKVKDQSKPRKIIDQLFDAVEQKIADLIFSTLYPRIASQVQQGAFRTTYVLLPHGARGCEITSKFGAPKFTETVYLEEDQEKFLNQREVIAHFKDSLHEKVGVPVWVTRREVCVRRENEFGILETGSFSVVVIDFELGRPV